jgi:hypothetical protein
MSKVLYKSSPWIILCRLEKRLISKELFNDGFIYWFVYWFVYMFVCDCPLSLFTWGSSSNMPVIILIFLCMFCDRSLACGWPCDIATRRTREQIPAHSCNSSSFTLSISLCLRMRKTERSSARWVLRELHKWSLPALFVPMYSCKRLRFGLVLNYFFLLVWWLNRLRKNKFTC